MFGRENNPEERVRNSIQRNELRVYSHEEPRGSRLCFK